MPFDSTLSKGGLAPFRNVSSSVAVVVFFSLKSNLAKNEKVQFDDGDVREAAQLANSTKDFELMKH